MAVLLSQFGTETLRLAADHAAGLLKQPQFDKAVDELIDRLAEILRGENPRYMAIPWFTDADQLARSIHDDLLQDYADQPEFLARLKADPIREQTLNFLTTITDPGVIETESEMSDLITANTYGMLGIPPGVFLPLEVHIRPSKSIVVVHKALEGRETKTDAVDDNALPPLAQVHKADCSRKAKPPLGLW